MDVTTRFMHKLKEELDKDSWGMIDPMLFGWSPGDDPLDWDSDDLESAKSLYNAILGALWEIGVDVEK